MLLPGERNSLEVHLLPQPQSSNQCSPIPAWLQPWFLGERQKQGSESSLGRGSSLTRCLRGCLRASAAGLCSAEQQVPSSLCHPLTHARLLPEQINTTRLFPHLHSEAGWKWMWGGSRGHLGIAPDGFSSVLADRFPASPGFCWGPGGQDAHPLWPGVSLIFQGNYLSLISRAKSFSTALPRVGVGPLGVGKG